VPIDPLQGDGVLPDDGPDGAGPTSGLTGMVGSTTLMVT
jgi:hypothetical protein